MHFSQGKDMIFRILFTFFLLEQLFAQQLPQMQIIGKGEKSQNEFVGSNHVDANGRICAMIRVVSDMEGFTYQSYNGVVSIDDQPGQDLVFLSPDERVLEIYHTGYEPLRIILSEYGIHLHPREVWTIKITGGLQKQNGQSVVFLVQPPVEKINIDGKIYDITNQKPVLLSDGQHRVKIEKRGYRPLEQEIKVDKEHVLYNFTLQEVDLVPVTINSSPSGAQIFIDGIERGLTSKALNLFPGTYNLRLILSGHVQFEQTIVVKEKQTNYFDFTLKKDSGTLFLTVSPPEAKVLINKEDYSGKSQIELAPGLYRIEISSKGYYPQSENITIVLGQTLRKKYVLKQKIGKLNFSVSPAEAKVTLKRNGQIVKTWQGANYLKNLPTGTYTIEISANGYAMQTKSLTINEHQITSLDITLKKSMASGQSFTKVLGIEWVRVEGGTFKMGCTSEQSNCDSDEKPVHTVTVNSFYMGKYEVTNAQVVDVFNWALDHGKIKISNSKVENTQGNRQELLDLNDSDCQISYDGSKLYVKNNFDNYPVIEISWYGAVAFCNYLSERDSLTPVYNLSNWTLNWRANGYRLPTEAEWEYAARGGQKSHGYKYAGSNNMDAVAWYDGNSKGKTHMVGQKQPNELGLYDMSGNVWEWCQDWYAPGYYSKSSLDTPKGPASGRSRVLRGGGWNNSDNHVRVSNRYFSYPDGTKGFYGFRLFKKR